MISGVHFNHLRHENSWTSSLTFYSFFCLENASRESVKSPFLVNLVCRSTKFIEPWMTFFFQLRQPKKRRPEKQQTLPGCWFYYLLPTSIMHYTIWPHFFWIHILCSNSLYRIINPFIMFKKQILLTPNFQIIMCKFILTRLLFQYML